MEVAFPKAVDPLPRFERCPLGVPCHEEGLCRLHQKLDEAMQLVADCLRSETIASVITEASSTSPFGRVKSEASKDPEDSKDES